MKERRIEDYLRENETILWHGKAKENDVLSCKMLNVLPFLVLWLAAECVILGVSVTNKILGDFNVYYLILTIVAILLHLIPTVIWFMSAMRENERARGDEYAVTDERVIIMHSSKHDSIEWLSVKDVDDVVLRCSFAESILGTGRIELEFEDGKMVFHSVEDAKKLYKKVYRAVNEGKENKGE